MDACALFVKVGELAIAEDKRVVFFDRVPNSMKSRNSINEFVDLSKVDLDDGKAGRPFAKVLKVAMDFVDHCPETFSHVVGEVRLGG